MYKEAQRWSPMPFYYPAVRSPRSSVIEEGMKNTEKREVENVSR
jgi:hypothetical protein